MKCFIANNMEKIPKISGLLEFLPEEQVILNDVLMSMRRVFESFGFMPIDTPAFERIETLLLKGGNDHEIYGVHRLLDGDTSSKFALRFDLTVPLARYITHHYNELVFPFRCYNMGSVWRGERSQSGRYRQFCQFDIDCIAENDLSIIYDAELPFIVYKVLNEVFNIDNFIIRINNRKILRGFLQSLFDIEDDIMITKILRVIDKLEKIGQDSVINELKKYDLSDYIVSSMMNLFLKKMSNKDWLEYLPSLIKNDNTMFCRGIDELQLVINYMEFFGVDDSKYIFDPSMVRGLDYYTGTIYEVSLLDYKSLGSIVSGGRYDDLVTRFSKKKLIGVGVSMGITRLMAKLFEINHFENIKRKTLADVLVTVQDQSNYSYYINIANTIRNFDIKVELFLQDKSLGSQLQYANRKNFKFVIVANVDELKMNKVIVKELKSGIQELVEQKDLVQCLKSKLLSY